jgi:hypothetical protein
VKELWEQALLPYNLPLTIGLGVVVLFWLFSLLGAVGLDTLDLDVPDEGAGDGHLGDIPGAMLRLVNAGHVPLTVVLSVLVVCMWLGSIFINYYFNPFQSLLLAAGLFVLVFIGGVLVTKLITQPLVPLMRRLKEAEDAKPVIGEIGIVRSIALSDAYGQVEVIRGDGAPAILNARLSPGSTELPRGSAVVILSMDEASGVYLAREMPPISPDTIL